MARIIVATQAELDALPLSFTEYTVVEIRAKERIVLSRARDNSSVVARENSSVVARGNSSVVARENSSVEAWGNSSVEAWGNSSVEAWGNSSVVARGNSSVEAWGNSSVEAWGNSSVEAWGNSSVEAWGNSSVVARENSSVVAWGNSSVVARGNSSVEAWGNSSVEAWGNSSVEARENVCARLASKAANVDLHGYAACFVIEPGTVKQRSQTSTVIKPVREAGNAAWLDREGVLVVSDSVVLYKRVSADLRTQEGEPWETRWAIGANLAHPEWQPDSGECGAGKFHACSRPYFCDEFRGVKSDKYIALRVKVADLHCWDDSPNYPHKIGFREAVVLHEVTRFGKELAATVEATT